MPVLASAASPSSSIVPSTKSMSPDRSVAGKLVGELYIAAKIFIDGKNVNMEAIRHEIRILNGSGGPGNGDANPQGPSSPTPGQSPGATSSSLAATPGGPSLSEWKKLIAQLMLTTQKLPNAISCLPEGLKRDMASAIKLGRLICSGRDRSASESLKRIEIAAVLYRKLGGPSYL